MPPNPEPSHSLPNNPMGTLKGFSYNFWHLWYLTSKKIHNPVSRVFNAPLEYKFQQGQRFNSSLPQTGSRTYPTGKGDLVGQSHTAQTQPLICIWCQC